MGWQGASLRARRFSSDTRRRTRRDARHHHRMTELQWIFAILAGLYAWECLGWIRRGGVAFSSMTSRRWRIQHPTSAVGNHRGGFVLAMPLPPLGDMLVANQLPFSLGTDGVLFFVAMNMNPGWRPAQSGRFLTWEDIGKLHLDGKKLFLAKDKIHAAATPTLASHLFQLLSTLSKLPTEQRESAIKQLLRDAMDTKRIVTLKENLRPRTRHVRLLANILFVHVFVVAPVLITLIGIHVTWLGLVIVMFVLTLSIARLFYRAHREFYPSAKEERFTHTLTTALAVATSMRAHDIVSRPLVETFHPIAVAKVLLDDASFRSFARNILLDLRHPMLPVCPNAHPQAATMEMFFRSSTLEIMEAWLRENGVAPDELCRAPKPLDETCRAYCPRCEEQFTSAEHSCADCGGIELVGFPTATERGRSLVRSA